MAYSQETRVKLSGAGDEEAEPASSRQHLADHVPFDVGQPALDAVVLEGQSLVVEAEQVQDRGVEVVER